MPARILGDMPDVQHCSVDARAGKLDDLLILRKFAAQEF